MAEAGKEHAGLGLPVGEAAQWPLQRYGRFMPSGTGEPPGPGQEAGMASSPTWKVFDSSEESGHLVLTIVISGHFFISQGQTLLEGFSLIGSKNWLKIVRRMDCLLFGTTIKNKSRMFRVQFSGGSREQALEHCYSCVQNLAQYITVQVPDGISQEFRPSPGQGKGCVQSIPPQHGDIYLSSQNTLLIHTLQGGPWILRVTPPAHNCLETISTNSEQQQWVPAGTSSPGGRTSVAWLAQSLMASEELPLVYEQSAWNAEGLGPFLRLCLMDQNFPAFVEEVEKELKKLTGLSG